MLRVVNKSLGGILNEDELISLRYAASYSLGMLGAQKTRQCSQPPQQIPAFTNRGRFILYKAASRPSLAPSLGRL